MYKLFCIKYHTILSENLHVDNITCDTLIGGLKCKKTFDKIKIMNVSHGCPNNQKCICEYPYDQDTFSTIHILNCMISSQCFVGSHILHIHPPSV